MKTLQTRLLISSLSILIIGALITIVTLPTLLSTPGNGSDGGTSWFFTGLILLGLSLLSLGCFTAYAKKDSYQLIFWGGLISALVWSVSSLLITWAPNNLTIALPFSLPEIATSSAMISFSCSYLALLSLTSPRTQIGRAMLDITTILVLLTTGLILVGIVSNQLIMASSTLIGIGCVLIIVTSIVTLASNRLFAKPEKTA